LVLPANQAHARPTDQRPQLPDGRPGPGVLPGQVVQPDDQVGPVATDQRPQLPIAGAAPGASGPLVLPAHEADAGAPTERPQPATGQRGAERLSRSSVR